MWANGLLMLARCVTMHLSFATGVSLVFKLSWNVELNQFWNEKTEAHKTE